jgi:creatinine amidohydrolase
MTALAAETWTAVAAATRRALVVPVGSCEQHGPHLPLDTDTRIAVAVATKVVESVAGAFLGPALAVGASGEHAGFPGTLSIGEATLEALVVELVRDADRDWPCVLVVNGHGGNAQALDRACALLTGEGRLCRAWTASWQGGDAHAGRIETSLMLAIDPSSVRLGEAAAGDTRPIETLMPALRAHGVRQITPNGVLGDPTGAGEAEGRSLLAGLATACAAVLHELIAPDPGRRARQEPG